MVKTPHIIDHNDFSTETGYLRPGEADIRDEICLNGRWDFQPMNLPADFILGESTPVLPQPEPDQWESVKLKVPSPWNINGFVTGDGIPGGDFVCYPSYPEYWNDVKMGWMQRKIHIPVDWEGQSIQLHFEAVCGHCQVYIDGVKVSEHFDNSLPETYSLDGFVSPGKTHTLWVGVRAPDLFSVKDESDGLAYHNGTKKLTYPTGSFFNMNTTGIWQDVYLLGVPRVRITDVFVQPDLSAAKLKIQVTIENRSGEAAGLSVNGVVKALQPFSFPDDGIRVVPHYDLEDAPVLELSGEKIIVAADSEMVITLAANVSRKLQQWNFENPKLYAALLTLTQDGKPTDCKYTRFGWREFKIKNGDFYLNDRKIQIKADSWHFMGIPQMTRRYAFAWYRAIQDAGGNGVRLHAMPYPTFYLEVADEMGICVLDESAIWASHSQFNYAEPSTWERFSTHVTRLVLRDRNYPSVMGWSVENEVRMELDTPFLTEEIYGLVKEQVCKLRDIVRKLDPTRDWISGDGSSDWDGEFPTSMLHYENIASYPQIKKEANKPVGVGECTIAYFGSPKHAAEFAGDLAYQSAEERMKGVAIEADAQLQAQLAADFSYASVFNLAWYALKPLPLGHARPENAPTIENRIYFGNYQEGKPGVQPERLGPYCTTLNPGYDPDLPMYEPWPMYDAIKSAFASGGPLPSPYKAEVASPPQKPLPVINNPAPVAFIGETNGVHYQGLKAAGVQFSAKGSTGFIYADLAALSPLQRWRLKRKIKALKKSGGTIFLSGLTTASTGVLEILTGEKIEIYAREAASLVFAGEYANTDPLVDHFRLGELYFAEDDDNVIQRFGIRSENLDTAEALLKSCGCDWRLWNHQPETSKTGALYRSEKEPPVANSLIKLTLGKATILLSTIEMRAHQTLSERNRKHLWHKLMKATGAQIADNFGKDARFSTYTPAQEILKNPQATAVVRKFIPMVGMLTDEMIAEISSFNIRELAKMHGRLLLLSKKKLEKIDLALSEIPLEMENSIGTSALEGDQIIRALVAGFFVGHDPAELLNEDFLSGENNIAPTPGAEVIHGAFSTAWQVQHAGRDGFRFAEMGFDDQTDPSACYLSFHLNSPRDLENLLIEPNVPQLYLNLETTSCFRAWLNGKEIYTHDKVSSEPAKVIIPLLLGKGINHILLKVVNVDTNFKLKAYLSSTHEDFIGKLESTL